MTKKVLNKKTISFIFSLIAAIIIAVGTLHNSVPELKPGMYHVTKVVDGDTVDVISDAGSEKLRLIGINTPETVDPRKPVECFGKEASDHAKALLTDKDIKLEFDPSQDKLDKYGRTLAYVYLEDGTSFNKAMIEDGYAYEYTYDKPYKYQAEFKQAQKEAELNKRGLWALGKCGK